MKSDAEGTPQTKTADTAGEERPAKTKGPPLVSMNSALFKDVQVQLQAKLGQVGLSVQDLLALHSGSVLKLDAKMNDLIDLRLNGTLVARGEIVAVDDNFGVRIVEVAKLP